MWLLARKVQWIFWVKTCCSRLFCDFSLRSHDTRCIRDVEYDKEMETVSFLGYLFAIILRTISRASSGKPLFLPSSMSLFA